MDHFHVSEQHISEKRSDDAMRQLVQKEIRVAREMMLMGEPLGRSIPGRFGFQLRIMINGGLRILELLEQQQDDYFSRPRLKGADWFWMVWRAIWKTPYRISSR